MEKITILDFHKHFPDNATCLDYLFKVRFGDKECPSCKRVGQYHRRKGTAHYVCNCGQSHVAPKAGTIFEKSRTDLVKWFFAIFLMSQSRNGVSAKELERHLGVTYKCAYRIGHQVRKLMKENDNLLFGDVEADETYVGGKKKGGKRGRGTSKAVVFGQVQRKGKMNASVVPNARASTLLPKFKSNLAKGTRLLTDEWHAYKKISEVLDLDHNTIHHASKQYVKGDVHTNTIEGFWSQMKRSMDGTHHVISPKYLHAYVSEFQWRYNHRSSSEHLFDLLLNRVCQQPNAGA